MESLNLYSPTEERINIISHVFGCLLSVSALIVLVKHANLYGDLIHVISFSVFGLSLVFLYIASACYHSAKKEVSRRRLKVLDHAMVYVLIAGTYTPFTLITLRGAVGWVLFGVIWSLAIVGIILKLFFTGKFLVLSTVMYVFMGWIIIIAIKPLLNNLPVAGFIWLLVGGVCYTLGAILYSIRKIKLNHAIFHILVLFGSFCHFISVFFYVLPRK